MFFKLGQVNHLKGPHPILFLICVPQDPNAAMGSRKAVLPLQKLNVNVEEGHTQAMFHTCIVCVCGALSRTHKHSIHQDDVRCHLYICHRKTVPHKKGAKNREVFKAVLRPHTGKICLPYSYHPQHQEKEMCERNPFLSLSLLKPLRTCPFSLHLGVVRMEESCWRKKYRKVFFLIIVYLKAR